MILSDVLKALSTHCKKLGIEHKDLYLMLFEEEDINIEQTVKNVFGKRALNQRIFKKIITDDGFVHLTNIIKSKLLSTIGGHQALYQSLYQLVENDNHLSHTDNVRIITTSRETQAAYYASSFKNIRLIGLENNDIIAYLKKCKMSETKIGLIMASKPLVECLRIPLYICMFCAEDTNSDLPETPGEILYSFFHRNSSFYNIRRRATDTRTNPLDAQQTAFILDFVLPYIGWHFEKEDCFSVNETDFEEMIKNSIFVIRSFCNGLSTIPFMDFQYKSICLIKVADSLYRTHSANMPCNDSMLPKIIDCIFSYLGIVYQYQTTDGSFQERNRYAFTHHQFRDYFSAINKRIQEYEECQAMSIKKAGQMRLR
ncbi:hypothetical protein INF30_00790 [Lachnospiraceae bacterium DSM 108991]|uniref:Uncharacterized protein n=1 Tax=Claveliimonas monacensis TaxID=2779351 RepID=A0ABR9RFR1_9FIRM|nr:hypothetical protein [Claveliimonas monacensis]MBE5061807.1 hypothetical protein [Claveliimonas monacensis]